MGSKFLMLASIFSILPYKSAKAVFGGLLFTYIGCIIVSCQNETPIFSSGRCKTPAVGHFLIETILMSISSSSISFLYYIKQLNPLDNQLARNAKKALKTV